MKKILLGLIGLLFAIPSWAENESYTNLLDNNTFLYGYHYASPNGDLVRYPGRTATQPISVKDIDSISIRFSTNQNQVQTAFIAYDENGAMQQRNTTSLGMGITEGTYDVSQYDKVAFFWWNNAASVEQPGAITNVMVVKGSTPQDYTPYLYPIKIATTAYNTARFSPVVTELNDTIATIRSVVTNTINQTKAIADLQATKQTRPDEACPAGKKCLLVEDNDGQPHWYEIIENADGYTELQYVVGGLIDTGLYIKTTDIYELKYATTQDNTAYQFGYRGQSDYASANTFNATYSSGEASVLYIVDSNRNLKQCQFTTPTDTPVVFSWKGSVNIAPSVNGSSISCTGTTNEQTNPTLTYIIGGQNIAGTPQNNKPIKLYYFKVFASDGITLTHNFVPMRRNLDNVIGMYDTITGTFFQSANTNKPFTAGPEI